MGMQQKKLHGNLKTRNFIMYNRAARYAKLEIISISLNKEVI